MSNKTELNTVSKMMERAVSKLLWLTGRRLSFFLISRLKFDGSLRTNEYGSLHYRNGLHYPAESSESTGRTLALRLILEFYGSLEIWIMLLPSHRTMLHMAHKCSSGWILGYYCGCYWKLDVIHCRCMLSVANKVAQWWSDFIAIYVHWLVHYWFQQIT